MSMGMARVLEGACDERCVDGIEVGCRHAVPLIQSACLTDEGHVGGFRYEGAARDRVMECEVDEDFEVVCGGGGGLGDGEEVVPDGSSGDGIVCIFYVCRRVCPRGMDV